MKYFREDKCPLCGRKMEEIDGDMTCLECGYRLSYAESVYEEAKQVVSNVQEVKPAKKRGVFVKSIAIIASVVLIELLVMSAGSKKEENPLPFSTEDLAKPVVEEVQDLEPQTRPKMMQQLSMEIFHKDYSQVMGADLDQVVTLHFYYNDVFCRMVDYGLADGTTGTAYFGDTGFDGSQISRFKGLQSLKMEYGSVYYEDLYGLGNLTELWCDQDFEHIAQMIDPLQLTSLGITNSLMNSNLSGIEEFQNLTSLYLDSYNLESLAGLASLTNLRTLVLKNIDSIEDYSELYDMPKLESVYIDSKNLSDIGFVSNMKNLKELSVYNSKLDSIKCLSDCKDTLQLLDLSDNETISDYTVVSKMTHLSELTLNTGYAGNITVQMPDLSGMSELTRLHIGYHDGFEQMVRLPQLEELTLSDSIIYEFPYSDKLPKLRTLNLESMSVWEQAIEDIQQMTQLENISLKGSYLRGDMSGLLKMPALRSMNMEYCHGEVVLDHLQKNETLEKMNLNHATWNEYKNEEDQYTSEETNISFAEHTDIFAFFPNLKELYLEGQQLDNISFASDLKRLQFLDINNNDVTELAPLAGLEDLRFVICKSNPVKDYAQFGSKVSRDW